MEELQRHAMQNSNPTRTNNLGQPIGIALPDWRGAVPPNREPFSGRLCRLESLDAEAHAETLYAALSVDADERHWTYLPYGPFPSFSDYQAWVRSMQGREDVLAFAIIEIETGLACGVACYLRLDPANGSIEVGHLRFSAALQRTALSTEAMYLMMKRVFEDWGYRRYEWKCDALNSPSRSAAERLGFQFEGVFRNSVVMKGRNRDSSWYSILDTEWPEHRRALEAWLDPGNFGLEGEQKRRLAELRAPA